MSEPKPDGSIPDEAGAGPDRMLTEAEFNAAMEDPEFFERTLDGWRRMLRGELGEIPAEAREQIERAVRRADEQAAIALVVGKLRTLIHVMHRPGGTMVAGDRLAQCQALVEEITDLLLDIPEPDRTEHLKEFLPVRDAVRAMKTD